MSRYLDDLLNVDNTYFDGMVSHIYPNPANVRVSILFYSVFSLKSLTKRMGDPDYIYPRWGVGGGAVRGCYSNMKVVYMSHGEFKNKRPLTENGIFQKLKITNKHIFFSSCTGRKNGVFRT